MNNKRAIYLVGAVFLFLAAAYAQTETGQITGTALDPTGAVIPNAAVTAKGVGTGVVRSVTTGDSGAYTFTNLLPGDYDVSASAPGFTTLQQRVTVTVGGRVGLDFHLEVGKAETTVEVTEGGVQVETTTQTLGAVINQEQLRELPNLTRNPYQFAALAGNVSDAGIGTRGVGVAINGLREASTNVLLDGASNNDEFDGNVGQQVPLDSVQEFSVLTANFTAEFGRASGGIVNVVTKSGSNEFHGTAYEFNRVSRFSSNSFDNDARGQPKSVFDRNQFGYSVGGPIVKNKLFFFNSTEWVRVRSNATNFTWIPTPNLIAAAAPGTQAFFNAYGQVRAGATVAQTLSRNQIMAQGGGDPCAGSAGGCLGLNPNMPLFQEVVYNVPNEAGGGLPQDTYMNVSRFDYNLSDKTQMYGRYALYSEKDFVGTLGFSPYTGFDTGQTQFNNNGLFSVIHTFSPRFISQSKVVFNRLYNVQPLGSRGIAPTMYANPNGAVTLFGNDVGFPGYYPFTPGNGGAFGGPQNYVQIYEDLSYNFGKHNLRFGGTYDYQRDNRTYGAYQTAVDSLTTGSSLGGALDQFLAGQYSLIQVAVDPQGKFPCADSAHPTPDCTLNLPLQSPNFSRSNRYNEFAFYVQDAWKITPRLTLNMGLRWEYFGVQHNKNASLDANYYTPQVDLANTNLAQYIRTGQIQSAPQSPVGGLWEPDYRNFGPRLGLAWDVFGDGKTSLRGGWGIGYERNFGNVTFNVIQNPPGYAVLNVAGSISPDNLGPLAGNSGSKALPPVSLRIVNPDIRTAYAHMWNVSLEHEFGKSVVAALEYAGSKGVNLYSISYPNNVGWGNAVLGDPCTGPDDCTNKIRTTQYGRIGYRGNQGFSDYNGLNMKLQVRNVANTGLDLVGNYTWSHAIDNLSSTFFETGVQNIYGNSNITVNNGDFILGLMDPFNPNLDRGDAEFDVRQRLTVSAIWSVPAGKGSGLAHWLLGGWSMAPILTARTGEPFSIFDSTNGLNFAPRAAFIGKVPRSESNMVAVGAPNTYQYITFTDAQIDHYINPVYGISDVPPFPSDVSGRDAFRAPGFWNVDVGLYKTTKITERMSLQLRAETFNLFNHANLYVVGASADVGAQNYVTACRGCTGSSYDRRNLQLAAKIIF
ncbi:MAG TPA: TonB-dependent receptor [Bryobacteraceae bacterium]|nr:TonB-dependent receptor [Bryobacteraceae bacterium]